MVYRHREPFFQPQQTDRLFAATACIVPKDKRLSPQVALRSIEQFNEYRFVIHGCLMLSSACPFCSARGPICASRQPSAAPCTRRQHRHPSRRVCTRPCCKMFTAALPREVARLAHRVVEIGLPRRPSPFRDASAPPSRLHRRQTRRRPERQPSRRPTNHLLTKN